MSAVARRFTLYGVSSDAGVRAERIRLHGLEGSNFMLITPRGKADVYLRLPGHHSVSNALAAAAVALEFDFDAAAIASALHGFAPPARRMNIVTGRNGATVIDDSYNASPGSMHAALEVLGLAPRGALKVAVWINLTKENKPFYSVTTARVYKNGDGEWTQSYSYGRNDLLPLAEAHLEIGDRQLEEFACPR